MVVFSISDVHIFVINDSRLLCSVVWLKMTLNKQDPIDNRASKSMPCSKPSSLYSSFLGLRCENCQSCSAVICHFLFSVRSWFGAWLPLRLTAQFCSTQKSFAPSSWKMKPRLTTWWKTSKIKHQRLQTNSKMKVNLNLFSAFWAVLAHADVSFLPCSQESVCQPDVWGEEGNLKVTAVSTASDPERILLF